MRNIRNCEGVTLETGVSACPVDFGHIKAIILVEHGKTLGTTFTPGTFEQMCHADVPDRIYPIKTCVEYAKSGGEPQVSATGYGGNGVTGISPQTDTFTLDKFYDSLAASITKNMNKKFDAYYLDENNLLIGVNTGADALGGIPMSTIYCTVVPHPTSSAKASMTVSLCLEDARKAIEHQRLWQHHRCRRYSGDERRYRCKLRRWRYPHHCRFRLYAQDEEAFYPLCQRRDWSRVRSDHSSCNHLKCDLL